MVDNGPASSGSTHLSAVDTDESSKSELRYEENIGNILALRDSGDRGEGPGPRIAPTVELLPFGIISLEQRMSL